MRSDSFQSPGDFTSYGEPNPALSSNWATSVAPSPAVEDCAALDFQPDIEFAPTTTAADAPSGLIVDLLIPQNNTAKSPQGDLLDPPGVGASQGEVDEYVGEAVGYFRSDAGLATAHLDKAVVSLPEGFSVNPSAATGLTGCSDEGIGVREQGNPPLFNDDDPFDGRGQDCPHASILGVAKVETPLLDEPLNGELVLGDPKSTDPASGQMFRLFRFVLCIRVKMKGGDRGMLALPQRCGNGHGWSVVFTPWTAANNGGGIAKEVSDPIMVDGDCSRGFAPTFAAGMDTRVVRAYGTFSFKFSRTDGEQWLQGVTAKLPEGLLASVRNVPLCTGLQASTGSCPQASKIGIVDAKAGSGDPFVLEQKGEVFLTEGYKGCE